MRNIQKIKGSSFSPLLFLIIDMIQVKTKRELRSLINKTIKEKGNNCDLNFIDTSNIKKMSFLFDDCNFNGDISRWDTSNVRSMEGMFNGSRFNGDISQWDTSKVVDMSYMFYNSSFNRDISKWNTSSVTDMSCMFRYSKFNGDISQWNVGNVRSMYFLFRYSKFNGDISNWNTGSVKNMEYMFFGSDFNRDISNWNVDAVNIFEGLSLNNEEYLPPRFRNLDQNKEYIGWKKLQDYMVCKLKIPVNSIKIGSTFGKCRCSEAEVLEIMSIKDSTKSKEGYSLYDYRFKYEVGKVVKPRERFDNSRWRVSSSGIHFFLTREEAINY